MFKTHLTFLVLKGMNGQSETLVLTGNMQESCQGLKLKQNMMH